MHDTAYNIGGLVMSTYLPYRAGRILEIGSLNGHRGLRDHAPRNADYIGLDFASGTGVDHVVTGIEDWPVDDDSFDLVMASSAFEHDPAFWRTFLAMCRKTRPGGYLYLSARTNGAIQRHPRDCWRFYPDAGLALQDWARQHGIEAMLVESFIAECEQDRGHTFCAVFRREPGDKDIVNRLVNEQVACTNVLSWRTREIIRQQPHLDDRSLIDGLAAERDALARDIEGLTSRYNIVVAERDRDGASLADREREIEQSGRALQAEIAKYQARIDELSHQLDELKAQANFAESNLRQREEENHQYRVQIDALKADLNGAERLGEKLAEADAWIFRLSGERTGHQLRIRQLEAQVAGLSDKLEELTGALKREAEQHHQVRQRDEAKIAQLVREIEASDRTAKNGSPNHQSDTRSLEQQLADIREKLRQEQERAARAEGRVRGLDRQLSERPGETAKPTQRVPDREQEALLRQDLAKQSERAETLETQNRALQDNLRQRFTEITRLTQMIVERDQKLEELDWLRRVFAKLARRPSWWFLMPEKWRQQREQRRLKNAHLFDAEAYVTQYPDVAEERIDPLLHYILHGMGEARTKCT